MANFMKKTVLAVLAFVGMGFVLAAGVHAQEAASLDGAGLKRVQQALESSSIEVVRNGAGQPVSILAKPCNTCDPVRFLVSDSLSFHQGGERLNIEEAAQQSGWPGTVIHKTDSEMAEKVIFFAR
ncbi:hypothetical protein CF392_12390 [Tamilnaduibacter salinus]|uniref:Uncharacterized protein n=1 Tax=Tamilnaduibacter salinus TaxID=1484056 RepID=A0A2A2I1K3_9GAMM|nr:hypothetical protein [Tamilnaduibacter salinus]PAV25164.1 hypothetical protein CF392_12390 [Tamilnaduibacter salinus]